MNRNAELAKALNAHASTQSNARTALRKARELVTVSALAVTLAVFSAFAVAINLRDTLALIVASIALGIAVTLAVFAIRETVRAYAKVETLNAQVFAHMARALGHASVITGERIYLTR